MIRLRAAAETDAGSVGAILSEFVDTTPWMPRLHSRAEDIAHAGALIARGWVTVAEAAEGVVGFAARDGAELNALYVAQAARGQGVGSDLLAQAKRDTGSLALWTFEANAPARRFYLAHGFAETDRTDGSRNDEGLPDIRFEWKREAA